MSDEKQKEEEKIEFIPEDENNEESGIKIADDVVAVIAGKAASEVSGVFGMAGGFAGGITEVFGKKNFSKGIKVDVEEKSVKIDVNIIVEYGARIPDVAFEIQNRVKKAVESMTGFKVEEVNVHVQGVKTEKDEEEKLINQMLMGDTDARGKLIEHNLRLVAHIVKKYEGKELSSIEDEEDRKIVEIIAKLDREYGLKILLKNEHDFPWNNPKPNIDNLYVVQNWKEIYQILEFFNKKPEFICKGY